MPRFARLEKVIGRTSLDILKQKSVLVLGCGGVGGYVVEALVRSGIGKIIIVDFDIVEESNLNRQIIALSSTIGKQKVDVLEERIHDISSCEVVKIAKWIQPEEVEELLQYSPDYFVDACDAIPTKEAVIQLCLKKGCPFISCMGTGNRIDPTKLQIIDLRKTQNDPIARKLRKFVKEQQIKGKIPVLFSTELPIKTHSKTPGSTAFVPAAAGLCIASYVVQELIKK